MAGTHCRHDRLEPFWNKCHPKRPTDDSGRRRRCGIFRRITLKWYERARRRAIQLGHTNECEHVTAPFNTCLLLESMPSSDEIRGFYRAKRPIRSAKVRNKNLFDAADGKEDDLHAVATILPARMDCNFSRNTCREPSYPKKAWHVSPSRIDSNIVYNPADGIKGSSAPARSDLVPDRTLRGNSRQVTTSLSVFRRNEITSDWRALCRDGGAYTLTSLMTERSLVNAILCVKCRNSTR